MSGRRFATACFVPAVEAARASAEVSAAGETRGGQFSRNGQFTGARRTVVDISPIWIYYLGTFVRKSLQFSVIFE